MATIFTKIVKGEIPCYKIAEDEHCFAFLDINPLAKGHTLVIPKAEIDYILDIDDKLLAELAVFAKKVAKAIEKAISCKRIAFAVLGLEVPHTHIHLVPIHSESDMNVTKSKLKLPSEEMVKIAEEIRKYIEI
jgi:histidine triad (HIT) family protein